MSCDVDTQRAQLLDESPDFGATGTKFGRELGAADHDRGVAGKQAHDAAKADVGFLPRRGAADLTSAGWDWFRDAGIITSRVAPVGEVARFVAWRLGIRRLRCSDASEGRSSARCRT
jgi:hypothetical protein